MIKNNLNDINDKIIEYFNSMQKEISNKMDIMKDYDYEFYEENNNHIVNIFLKGKLKLKAEYNIIGLYNIPMSVWYWGWNIAFINKNLIKDLDKVKDFINIINNEYKNFDKLLAEELFYILTNGNFYISYDKINIIIKLTLYLTKTLWFFPIKYSNKNKNKNSLLDSLDKIEYIMIKKILEFN